MPPKPAAKPAPKPEFTVVAGKKLTKGQLAYEQERAKQAGKSLEDWMKAKAKTAAVEAQKAAPKPDKAHKPI